MANKSYLRQEGYHEVLVIGAEEKTSSKGDPMLVLTFKETAGDREICGYYVPKYDFMAKALQEFKTAIGVGPQGRKTDFIGKKLMIRVEQQKLKPGQAPKINEKTGKPYEPSFQVVEYSPVRTEAPLQKEDYGSAW